MMQSSSGPDFGHGPESRGLAKTSAHLAGGHLSRGRRALHDTHMPITPTFVLHAARRWWKLGVPIGLSLAAVAALAAWLLYMPTYVAEAWLEIKSVQPINVFREREIRNDPFVRTQLQLIRSPLVLERVATLPKVVQSEEYKEADDPNQWLRERTVVRSLEDSDLYIIGFESKDPVLSALISNAIIDAYFKVYGDSDTQVKRSVIDRLQQEKARRERALASMQRNIIEDSKDVAAKDPYKARTLHGEGGERIVKMPIDELQNDFVSTEVDRKILEKRLAGYKKQTEEGNFDIPEELIAMAVKDSVEVQTLVATRGSLAARLASMEARYTNGTNHAHYKALAIKYEATGGQLEELVESLSEEYRERKHAEILMARKEQEKALQAELSELVIREELLGKRYYQQLDELAETTGQAVDITFSRKELEREQDVFQKIAERIMEIQTEKGAPPRVIQRVEAKPPLLPSNQTPWSIMALLGMAAFCAPFGVAVVWERMVHRVEGTKQLWQAGMNVVGEVARLPSSTPAATTAAGEVGREVSLFEESIDSLRTCLALSDSSKESRVFVVTSSVAGEGKTSVGAQLAVSIARATGEPTLLIDADMRSPDLHNVFDLPNERGLAQVLSRQCRLEDAIVTTWSNYVHILPAGVLQASPHKLLADEAFKSMMDQVRSTYRYIVIDTSPILSACESLILAKAADATLLCTMREKSRMDQVQRAYERLENTGAKTLGAVLNGVPTNRYAYLYGMYAYQRN